MSKYSDIVETIYYNYRHDKNYKINITDYNKIDINVIIALIINNFTHKSNEQERKQLSTYKNTKYYKLMHYVYELLQLCDKEFFDNLLENTSYLQILSKINNGSIILYKLKNKLKITKTKILEYCYLSAEHGSYNTFKFWYDTDIDDLIKNYPNINSLILSKSIVNSDERIYKFLLQKTKFNIELIKKIILCLDTALNIQLKYKIRRIKILTNYININDYFNTIIFNLYDYKLITHLYRMVIRKNYHDYSEVYTLYNRINNYNHNYNECLKDLYPFLAEHEKDFLTICIGHNIINPELHFSNSIIELIKKNYKLIINNLLNHKVFFKINNNTLTVLCEEKLINKYLYNESTTNKNLLLYTRFYHNNKTSDKDYINYNKLLHLLRIKMKKIYNKRINGFLNKINSLNNEIISFEPKNIPVLKSGSKNYQYNKQRFSNIPPRHLIATLGKNMINELQIYTTFLLREKPDGVLTTDLPISLYPKSDLFNNIKVKAEYIEEHDLYLVFDIDIPNTTIIERYEILRKAHPYTNKTQLEQINNMNDFMVIMTKERELMNKFMKEKPRIKWFPKFATLYSNNDNNIIVNHFIDFINARNDNFRHIILDSMYYKCDGLILSPLYYSREIKIKPNSLLTIDLLYNGKYFVDYENNNMNYLLFIDGNMYNNNTVYRCYPDVFNNKFIVGEVRYDKFKPNKNSIITNICNLLVYKYEKINTNINQHIYYEKKAHVDYNLLEQLKEQTYLLTVVILSIEPKEKKKWLDLGSGSGKLLNHIQKLNQDYYIGIDYDIKKIIEASQNNSSNFIHADLNTPWSELIDNQLTFDYIVANFSIMHFFTDIFWEQLNKISNNNTIFIFNVPSDNWQYKKSYMMIDNESTYYNFDWVHLNNKKEPYISKELIYCTAQKYKWHVDIYHERPYTNKKNIKLVDCYSWFIFRRNYI